MSCLTHENKNCKVKALEVYVFIHTCVHTYIYVMYTYICALFYFWLAVIFSFYLPNYSPVLQYCICKTPSQGSSRSSQEPMSLQAAVSTSEINPINPPLHLGRPCASTLYPVPYINTLFCLFYGGFSDIISRNRNVVLPTEPWPCLH